MRSILPTLAVLSLLATASAAQAATLQAVYTFSGNLNAQENGVAALTATNPLGTNSFETATVFGNSESIYSFNSSSGNNAGLTFNDGTNLITPNSYSIEMVFDLSSLTNYAGTGWLRLVDTQNRQSDEGLYVDPSHNFDIYPDSPPGTAVFAPNTYYDLILTDNGTTASVYINGSLDFAVTDSQMNLNNSNNPGQLLDLFLDNTAAGGQGEFVSGNIALFEAFDGVLSSSNVATLAASPFANVSSPSMTTTPEPGGMLLLVSGAALLSILSAVRTRIA